MGEKPTEQDETEAKLWHPSNFRSASAANEAPASGIAIGEPGVNQLATGDPGGAGSTSLTDGGISQTDDWHANRESGSPEPPEAAINSSHSNIKNLREMQSDGDTSENSSASAHRPGDPIPDIDVTLNQNPDTDRPSAFASFGWSGISAGAARLLASFPSR